MGYEYVAIPKSETYKLIENAQKGDDEAKERLITQNAGLVKKVASKYASWGFDMDDLMQLGFVGLVKAINSFMPVWGRLYRQMSHDKKLSVFRAKKGFGVCN